MQKNLLSGFVFFFVVAMWLAGDVAHGDQPKEPLSEIVQRVQSYSQMPWEGDVKEYHYQYKRYPKYISIFDLKIEDFPESPEQLSSPLSFFCTQMALLNSKALFTQKWYSRYYQFSDDPQKFREVLLGQFPEITSEKECFQKIQKELLARWCIGEVKFGSLHAIICINRVRSNSVPTFLHVYTYHCFYEKDGRYYLAMNILKDEAMKRFMLSIGYTLRTSGMELNTLFVPPNPKYPTIPRWHCWCNKARTKAVLAELVDFDKEIVILRKYENKKLLRIKRENLDVEDNHRLWLLQETIPNFSQKTLPPKEKIPH